MTVSAAPGLATEVSAVGNYPANRFNQRERKLLQSVKTYVDAAAPAGALFRVIAGGTFTTQGGDANETIVVSGALSTDLAFAVLQTKGATPRTILTTISATNAINMVFSGDPSTDHVVVYQLLRAN